MAGNALPGDDVQRDAFELAVRCRVDGQRPLVELALEVKPGLEREGGLAVELGLAAQRHVGRAQLQVIEAVLAPVAGQVAGDPLGQRLAVEAQLAKAQVLDRDGERQLQILG